MDATLIIPIGLIVVTLFITLAILSWRQEQKRREALAAFAARRGLTFSAAHDDDLARQFRDFRGLPSGNNRYAFNVLAGPCGGRHVTAFDFHSETTSTDSKGNTATHHHYAHVVALRLDHALPPLVLAPEGVFSKIAQALGYDDIDFESHEFSRRFCVRSPDRKFAYDFCNATMIDFLLAHPRLRLECRDGMLVSVFDGRMDPPTLDPRLDLLGAVRDRLPDYLFAAA